MNRGFERSAGGVCNIYLSKSEGNMMKLDTYLHPTREESDGTDREEFFSWNFN